MLQSIYNRIKQAMQPIGHIQMAQNELEQAKRQLLLAQTATEWAASQVEYRSQQIRRLEAYLVKHYQPSQEVPLKEPK